MKKYYFEASRQQLEKATEPFYVSCAPATCFVYADDENEAAILAAVKMEELYHGTGVRLGKPMLTDVVALPADWNYGYDDDRKSGTDADREALKAASMIR